MASSPWKLSPQEQPLPPPPPHGVESHVRRNRDSRGPNFTLSQNQKPNRMDSVQMRRTDFLQSLLHLGPSTQFTLRLFLVRLFLTVASCHHFLHLHNTSWDPLAGSCRTTVCRLGVIMRDERFIRNDDFVSPWPALRHAPDHL